MKCKDKLYAFASKFNKQQTKSLAKKEKKNMCRLNKQAYLHSQWREDDIDKDLFSWWNGAFIGGHLKHFSDFGSQTGAVTTHRKMDIALNLQGTSLFCYIKVKSFEYSIYA